MNLPPGKPQRWGKPVKKYLTSLEIRANSLIYGHESGFSLKSCNLYLSIDSFATMHTRLNVQLMAGKIDYYLDETNNLTSFFVQGRVEANQIIAAIKAFYQGTTTKYVLWNSSQAQFSHLSYNDVERIANTVKRYTNKRVVIKTALVFSQDVTFGLGRMFESLSEVKGIPPRFMSFRTLDDAKSWLGIGDNSRPTQPTAKLTSLNPNLSYTAISL